MLQNFHKFQRIVELGAIHIEPGRHRIKLESNIYRRCRPLLDFQTYSRQAMRSQRHPQVKRRWFRKTDNWNDRAMPLGALWGTQMVREFRWEWVNLVQHEHNDLKLVGVFDKRRSIGVYPFHFVYGCIENGVHPTIELAFNMLSAGKVPPFEDNAYEKLMDGVRHIIPPA